MTTIRQITEPLPPESESADKLVSVFRAARAGRLQFTLDLHDANEDRRFLSEIVIPQNQFWIAESDGIVVGFIAFADGWVNHLYIAPEYQRQGIGRALLNFAQELSGVLQLWVFEVNAPAIQFYKKHGFRIIERTDGAGNEAKQPDVRMEWRAGAGAFGRQSSRSGEVRSFHLSPNSPAGPATIRRIFYLQLPAGILATTLMMEGTIESYHNDSRSFGGCIIVFAAPIALGYGILSVVEALRKPQGGRAFVGGALLNLTLVAGTILAFYILSRAG